MRHRNRFRRWLGTRHAAQEIRKATVEHFPYLIAFERHKDHALVLGVVHHKRRPLYWLARASQGEQPLQPTSSDATRPFCYYLHPSSATAPGEFIVWS